MKLILTGITLELLNKLCGNPYRQGRSKLFQGGVAKMYIFDINIAARMCRRQHSHVLCRSKEWPSSELK